MSSFVPHAVAGVISGLIGTSTIFATKCPIDYDVCYVLPLIAGFSGALTPDMDIKSKSSQCMYLLYTALALYLYCIDRVDLAFYTLLYSIIPQFFGHRGFIHSFIFGIISSVFLWYICYNNTVNNFEFSLIFAGTYFLGFVTHIMLDQT